MFITLAALLLATVGLRAQTLITSRSFSESFSPPDGTNGAVYTADYKVNVSLATHSGVTVTIVPVSVTIRGFRYEGREYTASQVGGEYFDRKYTNVGYSFRVQVSHKGSVVGDQRLTGSGLWPNDRYGVTAEQMGYGKFDDSRGSIAVQRGRERSASTLTPQVIRHLR